MLANNSSTSTCFAIFEPIKFMCFGSTFSCTHKEFPILRPPSMHTCPANAGTRNPRGLTRSAQDSILQSGWFKLCRRNQIGIMTEIMWTSQRSVRVSVLLMQQDVDIRSYKNSRLQKLLRLLFATPQNSSATHRLGTTALGNSLKTWGLLAITLTPETQGSRSGALKTRIAAWNPNKFWVTKSAHC